MKSYLLNSFLIISIISNASAAVLPILSRLEGVGSIYGAAYLTEGSKHEVSLAVAGGDLAAGGGQYTYNFSPTINVFAAAGVINNVSLTTTYNRGLTDDSDDIYLQNLDLTASSIGANLSLFNEIINLSASLANSTIKIKGFETEEGDEIELPGAVLHDVETLAINLEISLEFFDNKEDPSLGVAFDFSSSQLSGRKGQSDNSLINYGYRAILPLHSAISLYLAGSVSKASITKESSYNTSTAVDNALGVDCTTIADATKLANCQKLEAELIAYILQNNLQGTALPIGGNTSLRSFREFRYKAANTAKHS